MIYRVHHTDPTGRSIGYSFHRTRADAYEAAEATGRIQVDSLPTPRTKDDIITILYRWAGHPEAGRVRLAELMQASTSTPAYFESSSDEDTEDSESSELLHTGETYLKLGYQ